MLIPTVKPRTSHIGFDSRAWVSNEFPSPAGSFAPPVSCCCCEGAWLGPLFHSRTNHMGPGSWLRRFHHRNGNIDLPTRLYIRFHLLRVSLSILYTTFFRNTCTHGWSRMCVHTEHITGFTISRFCISGEHQWPVSTGPSKIGLIALFYGFSIFLWLTRFSLSLSRLWLFVTWNVFAFSHPPSPPSARAQPIAALARSWWSQGLSQRPVPNMARWEIPALNGVFEMFTAGIIRITWGRGLSS